MDKEKLVRDLVNTFEDRDILHFMYKKKMREILSIFIGEFLGIFLKNQKIENDDFEIYLEKWIDDFVEERFKPIEN